MTNLGDELALQVASTAAPRPSHARYTGRAPRAHVHDRDAAAAAELTLELISTCTGRPDADTIATHLTLGHGRDGKIESWRHPHDELNPVELARLRLRTGKPPDRKGTATTRHPARVSSTSTRSALERVE